MSAYVDPRDLKWATTVWQRHRDALRMLARSSMPAPDVDDALSDTVEVLARARASFDPSRDERAFVLGVAANVFRHQRRGQGRFELAKQRVSVSTVPEYENGADEQLDQQRVLSDLREAIDALPEAQKEAVLALNAGMTAEALAQQEGVPASTIRARVMHARRKLHGMLSARWGLVALFVVTLAFGAAGTIAVREIVKRLEPVAPTPPPTVNATTPARHTAVTPDVVPEPVAIAQPPVIAPIKRQQPVAAVKPVVEPMVAPPEAPLLDLNAMFNRASTAHFEDNDYARASTLWESYLRAAPVGALSIEARFNWVIALLKAGHLAESAREARRMIDEHIAPDREAELRRVIDAVEPLPEK